MSNFNYNPSYYGTSDLFDVYDGFIRGNLFRDSYDGYRVKPYELDGSNERECLLLYVMAYDFACHDLNLYLDVYPDNRELFDLFKCLNLEKDKFVLEYESLYGPIDVSSSSYPFSWSVSHV